MVEMVSFRLIMARHDTKKAGFGSRSGVKNAYQMLEMVSRCSSISHITSSKTRYLFSLRSNLGLSFSALADSLQDLLTILVCLQFGDDDFAGVDADLC